MIELINRYDVYAEIQKSFNKGAIGYADGQDLMDRVKQIQTAVVRCAECVNWDRDWEPYKRGDDGKEWHYCSMIDSSRPSDWFCKDGERKYE